MVTFNQFFRGIAKQESGGDWHARGPLVRGNRAYGKYQVMDFNIPSWTARHYGRRLTPNQFRYNKAAQVAVARGVLKGYWNKYGARGAASAWYSGNPRLHMSTRPQGAAGPSIKSYVDSVLRHARGASSAGSAGGAGGSLGGGGVAGRGKALTKGERAEKYGMNLRLINSSKSLRKLFNKAIRGNWSGPRFQAALKNTPWWRKQSSSLRKYITLKYTDPATYRQNRANSKAKLKRLAAEVGLDVADLPDGMLGDAIYYDLARGWNNARLKGWMGAKVKVHGGKMLGEAGEAFDALHELAYANGMEYSTGWYAKQSRKIVKGTSTIQNQENKIRRSAAAKYKAFAPQIKAGMNVLDLAAPYIQSYSRLLEISESDVDLSTKHVYNAMAGGHAGDNFPLWQFENYVRKDPRWRKTNNAREALMTTGRQVAREFGMVY